MNNEKNLANLTLSFILLILAVAVILIINKFTFPTVKLVDNDGDSFYTIAQGEKAIDCDDNDNSKYPGAPEIEGDGIDQDCDGVDKLPDFDPSQFDNKYTEFNEFISQQDSNKYIRLYENFESPKIINSAVIVENSKRIEISGRFEKAYLSVKAGVIRDDDFITPLTNGESVYFYIDNGDKGGHLIKSKSLKIDPSKLSSRSSSYLYKSSKIEFTSLPYRDGAAQVLREINLLEILNSENGGYNRRHYIGSFVSTNLGEGVLLELDIGYKCLSGFICSIKDITD